jgi:hypothetical protein
VSRFLDHAARILDAAQRVNATAAQDTEFAQMTILIGHEGHVHVVAGEAGALDRLQAEHGATMAFRVTHGAESVALEGREGGRKYTFTAEKQETVTRALLGAEFPRYRLR